MIGPVVTLMPFIVGRIFFIDEYGDKVSILRTLEYLNDFAKD